MTGVEAEGPRDDGTGPKRPEDPGCAASPALRPKTALTGKETEMKTSALIALAAATMLSACSSDQVIDNTVGVAAGTTKVVAKGAVGAGKLAYRGGRAVFTSGE